MASKTWRIVCLIVILPVVVLVRAEAVSISYTTQVGDQERKATVDIVERDRVSYVSLTEVARQLGGRCTVTNDRVEVDFSGGVALMNRDDTQVNASSGGFTLKHKIVAEGKAVYIALSDVVPLFSNAFHAKISQGIPDESAPPATPPAPEPQAPATAPPLPAATPSPATPSSPAAAPAPEPSGDQTQTGPHVVIIDPGHGGSDAGAIGPGGLKEKDVTLAIATRMARVLRETYHVRAVLTRTDDVNLSPEKRASAANYNRGDVAISIHTGTSMVPSTAGFEVFYPSPSMIISRSKQPDTMSPALARAVTAELTRTAAAATLGIREAPCRLFQGLAMPGIVIELGPISTANQEALLADNGQQQKIAEALAAGIMKAAGAAPQGTQ